MKEPYEGISRICVVCDEPFWCTDGDITCSSKCASVIEESEVEKNKHKKKALLKEVFFMVLNK